MCRGEAILFCVISGPTTVVCAVSLLKQNYNILEEFDFTQMYLIGSPTSSSMSGTDNIKLLQKWKKKFCDFKKRI